MLVLWVRQVSETRAYSWLSKSYVQAEAGGSVTARGRTAAETAETKTRPKAKVFKAMLDCRRPRAGLVERI